MVHRMNHGYDVYYEQVVQPPGKRMRSAINLPSEVPGAEWPGPAQERRTARLGSSTEVCGPGRASAAGRRGNDEPKGGGNGAGPETRAERAGRRGAAGAS
jgi:hypothetical protein